MLEFNNNHIFTGYLKQLLSSFNLPTTKVYSMQQKRYFDSYGKEFNVISAKHRNVEKAIETAGDLRYLPYIKENRFQEYIKSEDGTYKWVPFSENANYFYGKKNLHYTKNLIIKDNIYDSYTHEYLGDYLRFQRDYHDINLMPLYNCFSNRICNNLNLNFRIKQNTQEYRTVSFDSTDTQYKIYMLPVKFLQKYTIAVDCNTQVELCCWFFGKYQKEVNTSDITISEEEQFLIDTYTSKKNLSFNQPFIFDALWTEPSNKDPSDPAYETEMQTHKEKLEKISKWINSEVDLKLFIKVPFSNTSSITVLEGDYLNYNDRQFKYVLAADTTREVFVQKWETVSNHFVTNYEEGTKEIRPGEYFTYPPVENRDFKAITFLQLLAMNTGKSYPFADRLIEYLLGNVITEYDKIEDNVARVQTVMELNGFYTDKKGLWEKRIRPIMYDYMNDNTSTQNSRINHDIFGYVDKDVEKFYKGYKWTKDGYKKVTISNVNLYENLYNNEEQ